MKIIDFHCHLSIGKRVSDNIPELKYEQLIEIMNGFSISKCIAMINPFVKEYLCNVNPKHRISVSDTKNKDELVLHCNDCNKNIYSGIDPFREYNIKLIEQCRNTNILPFVFLCISKNSINKEIEFFETQYGDAIKGYKLHPTLNQKSVNEISITATNKPIIIHTGTESFANPINALDFAKRYQGNIIMAHMARFNMNILKSVSHTNNIYIDTSPFSYLINKLHCRSDKVFLDYYTPELESKITFGSLVSDLPLNKILFASDAPYGRIDDEVRFFKESDLSINQMHRIGFENAMQILKL